VPADDRDEEMDWSFDVHGRDNRRVGGWGGLARTADGHLSMIGLGRVDRDAVQECSADGPTPRASSPLSVATLTRG
jgi:hypothetical protein